MLQANSLDPTSPEQLQLCKNDMLKAFSQSEPEALVSKVSIAALLSSVHVTAPAMLCQ